MTFTTGPTLSRCQVGGIHYELDVTINSVTRILKCTADEFQQDPPAELEAGREAILDRLRSAVKEANATTFAQIRAAVENKTFKI